VVSQTCDSKWFCSWLSSEKEASFTGYPSPANNYINIEDLDLGESIAEVVYLVLPYNLLKYCHVAVKPILKYFFAS